MKNPAISTSPRRTGRRIGAVLGGLLFIFVTSTLVDVVMHATGVFPPWGRPMGGGLFLLATAYRAVLSIAGCYLTARLAPDRPRAHALALGGVGVLLSTVGALATWSRPELGPHWYPILLVVISLPCAFVGAALAERARAAQGYARPRSDLPAPSL